MKLKPLMLATILLGVAGPALAVEDTGAYVGGYVAYANLDDRIGSFNESAWGLGAYGGYHFNASFGFEGAMYGTDSFVDDGELSIAAWTFAPTLRHAFTDELTVYLKAGLVYQLISSEAPLDDDFHGLGYLLGTGADISLTKQLALRLFYEFSQVEPEDGGLADYYANTRLHQFGVGLHWRF